MRMVDKKLLDELIELHRQDFTDAENATALHQQCFDKALEIEVQSGASWSKINDLLWSIFAFRGLKENATNKTIYRILKELGWEVKDNG